MPFNETVLTFALTTILAASGIQPSPTTLSSMDRETAVDLLSALTPEENRAELLRFTEIEEINSLTDEELSRLMSILEDQAGRVLDDRQQSFP
jgi:hypothetical protein